MAPRPTAALLRVAVTDLTEPLFYDLADAYAEVNPNVALAPSLAPQASLAAMLQSGTVDLALTTATDPAQFATPLGYVAFRLVAHPSNPLDRLSLEQARGLFAGTLTNWEQVGGRAGQVQIVARGPGSDAALALAQSDFGPVTVTVSGLLAPTWGAMRGLVADRPNALGYLIGPSLDETVKPLTVVDAAGTPVDLRVLVAAAAAAEPFGPARDFLAWVQSPPGQQAVGMRYEGLGR